jgi:tetratricopeptide (TPR) repeat protein
MNRQTMIIVFLALVAGAVAGVFITNVFTTRHRLSEDAVGISPGAGNPQDYSRRIMQGEQLLASDPKNLYAWIQLGNDYFDTDQYQKAINAYAKALELDPNNPNVLTDQGVMYQRLGDETRKRGDEKGAVAHFQQAISCFERSQKLDPNHLQSLYNLGVVYSEGLNRPDMAARYWRRYLEIDSTSPKSMEVRSLLEQIKPSSQRSFH